VEEYVIAERIRRFVVQQFPATKNIGNEDSLLKNASIDSLGILEVVTFLENEFAIAISDDELLPENFESLLSLSKFVHQKANGLV
jgi:acyl carrier protein